MEGDRESRPDTSAHSRSRGNYTSGNDNEGYKYAVCEKDGDLKQFVKDMNTALNGRGGGKPFFAQGSVNCKWEEIQNFFKA